MYFITYFDKSCGATRAYGFNQDDYSLVVFESIKRATKEAEGLYHPQAVLLEPHHFLKPGSTLKLIVLK